MPFWVPWVGPTPSCSSELGGALRVGDVAIGSHRVSHGQVGETAWTDIVSHSLDTGGSDRPAVQASCDLVEVGKWEEEKKEEETML